MTVLVEAVSKSWWGRLFLRVRLNPRLKPEWLGKTGGLIGQSSIPLAISWAKQQGIDDCGSDFIIVFMVSAWRCVLRCSGK